MKFTKETLISSTPERVFSFHELPDAFERLVPKEDPVKIIQKADISVIGSRAAIEQRIFGLIKQKWVAEHTKYEPPHLFEDVQVEGPFKSWVHKHIFEEHVDGAILRDEIEFDPGYSILGEIGARLLIFPKIEKMFAYRHKVTKDWCESEN